MTEIEVVWDVKSCPANIKGKEEEEGWCKRAKEWYETVSKRDKYRDAYLRDHSECRKCKFKYYIRTGYYSLGSDSDVTNYGVCLNPNCKYEWEDFS